MIWIKILLIIASAILYRLGGMGGAWWKNTKVRDWGCPTIGVIWMLLFYHPVAWWVHVVSWLAMWGALSTYWDRVFGYDNFYMHGAIIGLAYILYGAWIALIIRIIVLALTMGGLNWFVNKYKIKYRDWIEEFFRGGITTLTQVLYGI